MNIQKIQQNNFITKQEQPQFTGIVDGAANVAATALRFLDVNQAWGATAVDVGCMVAPRTITDFGRGANAGFETMRREASGTANHAAIGLVYGPLAGMILGQAINSKYGINARKVYADSETVDMLGKMHFDIIKKNGLTPDKKLYAEELANSIHIVNAKNGVKTLSKDAKQAFIDTLERAIKNPSKENKALLKDILLKDLGKETEIVVERANKSIKAPLKDLADNIVSFSETLFKDNVVDSFKKAKNYAEVSFVKSMKRFGLGRSVLGLAIAAGIGCSIQPINIWLTKRKTGSDGFVGSEGREKDNSTGFKILKGLAALTFATGAILTIGNPKNLLKNIQYKSIFPTLEQFKLVYGLTIASRCIAARDKDELRESLVKDTIGFTSWLILGNFVAKGTLKKLNPKLVGKTRDEVLYRAVNKLGISTVKDGKALSFYQLLKELPKDNRITKLTKANLRKFTWAQLAGYAFSAVVLGVGIPKLNIYMTKKSEQKRAAQRNQNPVNNMLKPENIAFLNNQMNFTSNKMLEK